MTTSVTKIPPADSPSALKHFESCLEFETDCWDVHESRTSGKADFVLIDVRSAAAYERGHVLGARNLPHSTITEDSLLDYPEDTVFVVYCAGPHCNGSHRAGIRLSRLGRPVKVMIGGVIGWLDEGFELKRGLA